MHKARVLIFNHFAVPPGQPGGTRHVELFSRIRDWRYLIIASNLNPHTGKRVTGSAGLVTVPVPSYSKNGVRRIFNWCAYTIGATLRSTTVGRFDVAYGSSPHLLAPLAAWFYSIYKRVPFVLEIRDLWPKVLVDMGATTESSKVFKALTWLEEFLYEQADAIVVMAEGSRTELISRGVPQDKINYIPNGADPEDFVPSATRDELRERYSFTRLTAVYAGAHGPSNGLHLLLAAAREAPSVDVVLVGGGVLKTQLQNSAQSMGLANVKFLDAVPKTEIPDILAAADIGLHVLADVNVFRDGVSPNKVFDYMAARLPILTNNVGLVGDLIRDAGAGYAVAPEDLGKGLKAFASTSIERRQIMAEAGQQWIIANQSRTAMAQRLKSLLDSL